MPLHVRAVLEPAAAASGNAGIVVLVDALGAGPAIVQALDDAGEGFVEVAGVDVGGAQLADVVDRLGRDATVWLAALANARPAMSRLAREAGHGGVTFVCGGADDQRLAVEDAWLCGVLIRMFLDELDSPTWLDDAAGIAVAMVDAYDTPMSALSAGTTGQALEAAGRSSVLTAASTQDIAGCVPTLRVEGSDAVVVARA
jgi:phosphosulfolactate phosphohydrolase-like enzyme